jgi:hypothetical protein
VPPLARRLAKPDALGDPAKLVEAREPVDRGLVAALISMRMSVSRRITGSIFNRVPAFPPSIGRVAPPGREPPAEVRPARPRNQSSTPGAVEAGEQEDRQVEGGACRSAVKGSTFASAPGCQPGTAAASSDVHCGQRVAATGIVVAQ